MADEKETIKIVTLSAEGCKPCKDLQQEIADLSGKYDINLVVVDVDNLAVENLDNLEPNAIPEAFGKVDVVPTTIIETAEESMKLTGFTEGALEEAIEEVLARKNMDELLEEYSEERQRDIEEEKLEEEDND